MAALIIDFVADIVCPWCFIGRARLDAALALVPEVAVRLRWRPYLLNPDMPREGVDHEEFVTRLFGSLDAYRERSQALVALAAESRLDYRPERIVRQPNSVDGHRLIRWAADAPAGDRSWAMATRLMALMMSEGADLSDRETLVAAAGSIGLDADATRRRLATEEDAGEVRAQARQAAAQGVTGVPTFIFNGTHGLAGAQPPDLLARAIRQLATAEPQPA